MKARDALLLNNTITQNPILARRPWFGMLPGLVVSNYGSQLEILLYFNTGHPTQSLSTNKFHLGT